MSNILIVEDEHALGSALALAVRRLGHLPMLAASGAAALELLGKHAFEAVVLDIGLPDISGLEVLEKLRASGSKVPVLIITAHGQLDYAISSQKLGIADYLMKPLDLKRFEESLAALVSKGMVVVQPAESAFVTLIGSAPCMREVFLGIARACSSATPVLIHGPCGSGKSQAVQVIHTHGPSNSGPLRWVESASVHGRAALEALLATGGGTLVLKDITALDGPSQALLAEVLGGSADTRQKLIATTHLDPAAAVESGALRPDLFYTLSALTLRMPSLAERSGDIPALSEFFFGLLLTGGKPVEIMASTLCAMQAYAWPGNVRELRHVLEHAHAMSRGGPLFPGHLPPHVAAALQQSGGTVASSELHAVLSRWLDSQLQILPEDHWHYDALVDRLEATLLKLLMDRFHHRPTHLAAAMRLNRATLRQKLRRAGIAD
jgi:DNA-binding NtrC family response regulator